MPSNPIQPACRMRKTLNKPLVLCATLVDVNASHYSAGSVVQAGLRVAF